MRDAKGRSPAGPPKQEPRRRTRQMPRRPPRQAPPEIDFHARVLRVSRLLRIVIPILALMGGARAWSLWNHHHHGQAIVFGCILVFLVVALAGLLPWYLRRGVERRRETFAGQ